MTKILIVEDERVTAWNLQESLEALGYHIAGSTGSGEEAIALAVATRPNLVIMGICLEDAAVDGIIAAGRIRQELGIPIVYLTAHADENTLNRALATQPLGYLIKPFDTIELRTTIEAALHCYHLEQQLDESQRWFSTTLNSLRDGAIATDALGHIQFINPSAEALTGWAFEDAVGRPAHQILQLIDPETRSPIPDPFTQSIAQRDRVRLPSQCILVARDGTEKYIGDSAAPIFGASQEILGSVLIFQDITARVHAEQATQRRAEREQLLRTVTERIRQSLDLSDTLNTTVQEVRDLLKVERVVIYQFHPDLSGNVIAEALGEGIIPMQGITLSDPCLTLEPCISKYRQQHVQAIDDIHAASPEPCYVELLERFNIRASLAVSIITDEAAPWGLLAAQHCSARPWSDGEISLLRQLSGQISVAIHQSRLYQKLQDTTRALTAQIQERNSQLQISTRYEALMGRISEKVWQSLDERQIIQSAAQELCEHLDARFCNISFYSSPDAVECDKTAIMGEYCRDDPDLEGFVLKFSEFPGLWEQLRQGMLSHLCVTVPAIAHRSFCALVYPMYDNTHTLIGDLLMLKAADQTFSEVDIQVIRQVTHQCAIAIRQSRLHHAAQSQVEELERLNQLKDDFLSTVSHELRTPMANIRMATQMLEICLNRLGALDGSQNNVRKYFNVLKQESQREINLIDDLLNLSRLEAGAEDLNPIPVDLKLWVVHIAEAFVDRAQRHQQVLSVTLPDTLPLVEADLACLERLVTELLTNACKYTPAREQIRISATVQSTWVDLHITNIGVEIPPSEIPHIFKKFYRIPKSDRWQHGGTGLGLALAQKLAEVLGGYLLVTSGQQATTFTLRLPIPDAPPLP